MVNQTSLERFFYTAREHYSKGFWGENLTNNDQNNVYHGIKRMKALPEDPKDWPGKVIIDISANNLDHTGQFIQHLNADLAAYQNSGQTANSTVDYFANDISYKDHNSNKTVLGFRAEKLLAQIKSGNPHVNIHALIDKDAIDLTPSDLGDKKATLIIDRLGALWHYSYGDPRITKILLQHLSDLLEVGGSIVIDASPLLNGDERIRATRLMPTFQRLRFVFGAALDTVLNEAGFKLETEDTHTNTGLRIAVLRKKDLI